MPYRKLNGNVRTVDPNSRAQLGPALPVDLSFARIKGLRMR